MKKNKKNSSIDQVENIATSSKSDAYDFKKIFEEIESDLILSMKRTLSRHLTEQEKMGYSWEQWQSSKLRALRAFKKECENIVNNQADKISESIDESLSKSYLKGSKKVYQDAVSNGIKMPTTDTQGNLTDKPPNDEQFFQMNEKKLNALKNEVQNSFKDVEKSIFRNVDDNYRQIIYKTSVKIASGSKTLTKAVDEACQEFLHKGINSVVYKDGKRVNIATYAEMALRTASQRATFMGEGALRKRLGIVTVFISSHANTCELCAPYQGMILIDDVYSGGTIEDSKRLGYPLLSEAIKNGLFHPNCRHTMKTYFDGVTRLPKPVDEKIYQQNYAAEQYQRKLENNLREWKRVEQGALDEDTIFKASHKVKVYQRALREHLKEHGDLRRNEWREKVIV
ncbi:phage minor capsid protein [Anaerorhabdus sp.]|uniref:phage minor capsid protein n=1 Tax=Anaerorhabdus sp. TaxID=1872524 RepID=UPI002FC901BC